MRVTRALSKEQVWNVRRGALSGHRGRTAAAASLAEPVSPSFARKCRPTAQAFPLLGTIFVVLEAVISLRLFRVVTHGILSIY
jgi:hypothetical protein